MADYQVGYGKPPKHSRFKPGQSGNPKGRKKGSRGLKTDLEEELNSVHTIRNSKEGTKFTGTKQRLIIYTLCLRAASGDLKAQALLIPMIMQILGVEDRGTEAARLSAQDQALLDALLANLADPYAAVTAHAGNPDEERLPPATPDDNDEPQQGGL